MKRVLSVVLAILILMTMMPLSSIVVSSASSNVLTINWDNIKGTGHQSVSGPCGCYALAYCRDILDNKSYSWTKFSYEGYVESWGRYGYTVSWSKGNYAAAAKSTVKATLKAVYDQINNGRPAILHVKGGRSTGQHWVAVVGYQNVTDTDNLTYNNFLIIDSVASKYETENLGALGYTLKETSGKGYRYAYTSSGSVSLSNGATNNATYSFNFNANGGTLGSSGAFSVSYGEQFQVLNTTCTRSGYTWAGWNVKRNNDGKWYVDGQGWCTESQISSNGYIKKAYSNYTNLTFDDSWISGIQGNCSYTFYAVWVKDRTTMLYLFMSPLGAGGYNHVEALNNAVTYGFAQEHIYFWYVIYDQNTGDLLSTYLDKNFTVDMTLKDPMGEIVHSKKYTTSDDANWIGFIPQMSGTYTATVTLSGDYNVTHSITYDVKYDTELSSSSDTVSLNLNGTNTRTIEITPAGNYPGDWGMTAYFDDTVVEVTDSYLSNGMMCVSLKGLKYGSTDFKVDLFEKYTGNKNVVATITIPVKVTANTYIISYDANGGSGAPSSQTKYYGTDITLSSIKPVGKTYTVTFDGNGGSAFFDTKTYTQSFSGWNTYESGAGASYSPGSTFSSNLDVTLYAQWTDPNFSSIGAAREGYYFVGWYDSKSTDSAGLPTGKKYTSTTKISSNITLYAMWSKSANLLFGDYNLDGEITYLEDVSALLNLVNGLITTDYPIQEVMFRCDLNRDGELDAVDALIINKLRFGEITQSDLSSVGSKFVGMEIGEYPQRDFRYGGELETEYLSAVVFFENGTAYLIEDNYVVSGYDPYKIGTQTLTVNYYQYSTTYTVTVHPPQYTVKLNANGGTVKYSGYTFTYGEKIGTLVSPERDGYTFLGWTFEETGTNYVKPTDVYSYMSNKTLYAQWARNSYTISYNANGGSGAPTSQTKTHNVDLTLSSIQPTRTGYKFLGWATNSTDTTAIYQPNGNYVENSDVTLYAVWKVNTYTISYNANGGSGAPASQTKTHNVDLTLSSVVPTRAGYRFMGWATSSSATLSSYQPGATFTSNANTTLYAVWEKEIVLSSIAVYTNPSKTIYYIGDSFNSNGLVIKLTYSDGRTENASTGFTTSGFSSTTAGTKTITVSYGGKTTTFNVTVKSPAVTLSQQNISMDIGETNTITATITPSGQSVTWTSSNTSVATVSNGTITAKGTGTANITAKFTYNGIVYSSICTITVKESVKPGDINGDGAVDAGDAGLISRYDAGLITLTATQLEAGDVNRDGIVDAGDAGLISRYDAGLISSLG